MEEGPYQDLDSVSSKWRKMSGVVNRFSEEYNKIYTSGRRSGMSGEFVFKAALEKYKTNHKTAFPNVRAWEVMRKAPKWAPVPNEVEMEKRQKTSETGSFSAGGSDARCHINLNDDAEFDEEEYAVREEERPPRPRQIKEGDDFKERKAKGSLHHALLAAHDPRGYKLAAKHSKWVKAMEEELLALKSNNTWVLVPRPTGANIVGQADPSLFIYKTTKAIVYLLVYVDDIIITGNDSSFITSFVARLHQEFSVKDLGLLGYFLDLEVTHSDASLFLSQAKYAHDILSCAVLLDSKPVATPLTTNDTFLSKGVLFHDPTLYRSLVGALQYLTITSPDISYAVNQAGQHLQAPTTSHFQLVKRILRYVKGTIAFGLTFSKPTSTATVG
ncbi:uncharacterized protein LOC110888957 [Helianthus annuus]|uniref:uncharacterized protein LOC110888957 n=1 Tax=Helianthus annuus TaxID=4232 RepID=UPI000B8F263B|nr:uncharacterized protein LOC110888957 [Helianthus annuus]